MNARSPSPAIVWFRRDLRLTDNPALHAAIASKKPLVLLYIDEPLIQGRRALGGASKWWLNQSLKTLGKHIEGLGGHLILRTGTPRSVLQNVIAETGADQVYWNRRYDRPGRETDTQLKSELADQGVACLLYTSDAADE